MVFSFPFSYFLLRRQKMNIFRSLLLVLAVSSLFGCIIMSSPGTIGTGGPVPSAQERGKILPFLGASFTEVTRGGNPTGIWAPREVPKDPGSDIVFLVLLNGTATFADFFERLQILEQRFPVRVTKVENMDVPSGGSILDAFSGGVSRKSVQGMIVHAISVSSEEPAPVSTDAMTKKKRK